MIWYVVFKRDNSHPDPRKDPLCSKRGDIIDIHRECREPPSPKSKMVLIGVEDGDYQAAQIYLRRWSEPIAHDPRNDTRQFKVENKNRSLFRIDLDGLPRDLKGKLKDTGWGVFNGTHEQFEDYIINKRTRRSERQGKSPIITFPGVSLPRDWRRENRE